MEISADSFDFLAEKAFGNFLQRLTHSLNDSVFYLQVKHPMIRYFQL